VQVVAVGVLLALVRQANFVPDFFFNKQEWKVLVLFFLFR
jgi:hypothetical protein